MLPFSWTSYPSSRNACQQDRAIARALRPRFSELLDLVSHRALDLGDRVERGGQGDPAGRVLLLLGWRPLRRVGDPQVERGDHRSGLEVAPELRGRLSRSGDGVLSLELRPFVGAHRLERRGV